MRYELYYHAANPGRGEFIRLPLEEARADYVDVAREPGGTEAMMRIMREAQIAHPPFAPPFIRHGDLIIGQTANVLLYLGPRLGLVPEDEASRLWAHQLQLTIADLVQAVQHTHHPVAHGLYYDDQKAEALTYTRHFLAERVPKFLSYFERVLSDRPHIVGDRLSYVDLSLFVLMEGLRWSFPRYMARAEAEYRALARLCGAVAARPNISAYLASPRHMAFNDKGVFRRYPELEG